MLRGWPLPMSLGLKPQIINFKIRFKVLGRVCLNRILTPETYTEDLTLEESQRKLDKKSKPRPRRQEASRQARCRRARRSLPQKKARPRSRCLRGFKDVLPGEYRIVQHIEDLARSFARAHGFERIETPILEPTSLFIRTVGKQTDIVEKEMYTFIDKGEENVALRPEMTASAARAYVNHGMLEFAAAGQALVSRPQFPLRASASRAVPRTPSDRI